jgi:hypothetical protein
VRERPAILRSPSPGQPRVHGGSAESGRGRRTDAVPDGHGWRQRRNRRSGVTMLAIVATLALSGYGLYYAGDPRLRSWTSANYWVIGLSASAALLLHVMLGRRTRP